MFDSVWLLLIFFVLFSKGIGAFFYFDEKHISDMIFVYNLILAELSTVASFDAGVKIGGQAYFITDDQAVNLAAWEAWDRKSVV